MPATGGPVTPELFQRWGHSFEEDTGSATVFRPTGFDFPLARGRSGIEFRPDGTVIDWAIAAGDGSESRPGSWHVDGDGRIAVVTGSGEAIAQVAAGGNKLTLTVQASATPIHLADEVQHEATPANDLQMPNPGMGDRP